MTLPLRNNEVHLWWADARLSPTEELLQNCRALLCERELGRLQQYRLQRKQVEFALSHAFVRCVLSHYADLSPSDWTYSIGSLGRPEISEALNAEHLRFNLTHTEGCFGCGVSKVSAIGVDVEKLNPEVNLKIANRYFSPEEVEELSALPEVLRPQRFFELWTLKEAYLKAKGAGLHLPLDAFSYRFTNSVPRLEISNRIDDVSDRWRIYQQWITPDYSLAAVVEQSGEPVTFRTKKFEWSAIPVP